MACRLRRIVLGLVVFGLLVFAGQGRAEETLPAPEGAFPVPQEEVLTQGEVESFVKAYVKTQRLRHDFEASMAKVQNSAEEERLEREAAMEFGRILEGEGMDVESYTRMFTIVNMDEDLRAMVLQLIEEERKRPIG